VDDTVNPQPTIDPQDLIGTFVRYELNGVSYRARIARRLLDDKFVLELPDGGRDEIVTYNDLVALLNRLGAEDEAEDGDQAWTFSEILEHRMNKKTKQWEILIQWDTGEKTLLPRMTPYHAPNMGRSIT